MSLFIALECLALPPGHNQVDRAHVLLEARVRVVLVANLHLAATPYLLAISLTFRSSLPD